MKSQATLRSQECFTTEELLKYCNDNIHGTSLFPDPISRHLLKCEKCLTEINNIQKDMLTMLSFISVTPQKIKLHLPWFRFDTGRLLFVKNFLFRRLNPAYRSDRKAIIHSDIIPLPEDYILLELSNCKGNTILHLEKGSKNKLTYHISLYIDEHIVEKRYLRDRIQWDIQTFRTGIYKLLIDDKVILKFTITK